MNKWGKGLTSAFVAGVILAGAASAQAGRVVISGEQYNLETLNNFYNTYGGHTSTNVGSSIDGVDLSNVDLLWAVQPTNDYSMSELSAMSDFLAGGGRIAFMGEHGTFMPDENLRINAALSSLGSTISIINELVDPSFRTASVGDGQILSHALTTGVNTYEYAAFAPLTISGTAQALMLGENNSSNIMMAYQNIGPGSIFLITDQNVWDHASSLWDGFDNEVMFDNLVEGRTGAPPVGGIPEPTTWAMLIMGFATTGAALRRRRRSFATA